MTEELSFVKLQKVSSQVADKNANKTFSIKLSMNFIRYKY